MEKCAWGIGSARALTSPNAEITGGGGGLGVCMCVCLSVCSGQCRSLSSDKQVFCHITSSLFKQITGRKPGQVIGNYIQPSRSVPDLKVEGLQ